MNNLKKEFWKYISMGVLGMIGSAGTILTDAFFVSEKLGPDGLAAMNLAMCVFGLMNGTGLLFGIGGATRYTIFRSRNEDRHANSAFTLSFLTAAMAGLLYALTGFFFSGPISVFFSADIRTFDMCDTYLKTVLCFAPAFVLNHLLMAFVRNDGDPKLSMGAMLLASAANIVLDYVFLYPLGMGIFGAALATGITALLGIGVSSLHFLSKKNRLRFIRLKSSSPALLGQILSTGFASFITELSSGIVLVIFNLLILRAAGTIGVAAYGIVANLAWMIQALINGISHGIQPLISKMHGKNKTAEAKLLYRKSVVLTLVVGFFIFSLAYVFATELVQCFNGEKDILLQALAENGLPLYFLGFLFVGYNHLTAAYFSATEKPRYAFTIALFRGFIGITASACLLSALFGMTGIWLAFPAVEAVSVLLCLLLNHTLFPKRCAELHLKRE